MSSGMGAIYEKMFPEYGRESRELGDAVDRLMAAIDNVFDAITMLRHGVPELVRAALSFRRAKVRLGKVMLRR